jgi:two-component system response regulator
MSPSDEGGSVAAANKYPQRKHFTLIAEDDEDDQMLLEAALTQFVKGVDFAFVENGQELIDYLRTQGPPPPDLILLDLNMPLMDGREALQVIRSDPTLKDIRVVCFTTSSSIEDYRFCLDHGAAFHTKPALLSEISALIQTLIATS